MSLSSHDVSRLEDAEGSSAKCASEDHNLQSLVNDASHTLTFAHTRPHNFLPRLTMPGLSASKVIIFLGFFDTCAGTVSLPLPVTLTAAAKVSSESAVQPLTASLLVSPVHLLRLLLRGDASTETLMTRHAKRMRGDRSLLSQYWRPLVATSQL